MTILSQFQKVLGLNWKEKRITLETTIFLVESKYFLHMSWYIWEVQNKNVRLSLEICKYFLHNYIIDRLSYV